MCAQLLANRLWVGYTNKAQGWATSRFFFLTFMEKKPECDKLTIFFIVEKKLRYDATLLQTCHSSRFNRDIMIFQYKSRFPDSMRENPSFLFCFEIGKTKRCLTLSYVPCLQAHKVWVKNKFYDWLNCRPWLNPLHTATQRVK